MRYKSKNVQQFCSWFKPKNDDYKYPECSHCEHFKHGLFKDKCKKGSPIM